MLPSIHARNQAKLGLYVHVPFCAKRCSYCDFATGSLSAHGVERYHSALEIEIALRASSARHVEFSSVFFGGGTPSALSPRAFARVGRALRGAFRIADDAEITLEANPESVGEAKLEAWAAFGVNRLSMGAQSFLDDELAALGRIHDARRPAQAFALARGAGFRRLSLDLMFGFPGHDGARWSESLARAIALEPEHVSTYAFIPEPGTELGDAVLGERLALPDDETQADLYADAVETLGAAGYAPYETSNFTRPGGEVRHNLVYWLARPYLALGPGAHGFWNGERYENHRGLSRWATELERGARGEAARERPDLAAHATEVMMLGLRLEAGVARQDHSPAVWREVERRYGRAFEQAVLVGRLERTAGGFRIPGALRFLADDVLAWIEARAAAAPVDTRCMGFLTSSACPSLHSPAI